MGKTPTAARHALLACRHMLMAVSAICALAACGGDELTAPHEHTQDEIKARQYLGYYPCEIDIDDFHGWTADGSYHCSGINKKHLWFAVYDEATIDKWLDNFFRRFVGQQFKRSCLPDGPKVGTLTLSPRGDWRMPSDASASLWL